MNPAKEMVGLRFGRLQVLRRAGVSSDKSINWVCQCDCGAEAEINGVRLRRGTTKSCGCLARELSSQRATRHGGSESPEYSVWRGMLDRCNNPNNASFVRYGAIGVTVCPQWQRFEQFFADMGSRPIGSYSIDRIDTYGNYTPENCRWATPTQQSRNRRTFGTAVISGVHLDGKGFRASICTGTENLNLGNFGNLFDAVAARRSAENRYWTVSSNPLSNR